VEVAFDATDLPAAMGKFRVEPKFYMAGLQFGDPLQFSVGRYFQHGAQDLLPARHLSRLCESIAVVQTLVLPAAVL
jgi:hypothetical protein